MDFTCKEQYTIQDLLQIIQLLRAEDGCPWDRAQDHHSIRQNLIEETYEAVEAIDSENTELLQDCLLYTSENTFSIRKSRRILFVS